jgi:hypothetical protein
MYKVQLQTKMDSAFDFLYRVRKFHRKSVPKSQKNIHGKNFKVNVVHYPIVGTILILKQPLRFEL